ncbi:MAG TPA: glycoside hydrolase family 97 protein [Anaerohalosphaeraceae bacterium]|nr:glycoside hydrolase family 97 protein [Anaerohalosphaeraceae bacterium]HOL31820.1 glycoside hydrolase family 97 protein [Anaerohalosphaeraceae bacterium]HOM75488.1 glycoside hydrolase family 97 protein [Anaerohalosphaeraceae bacterium]HPC63784.1 glycoside hydrolase family 97 protein [Anaerohalosphaeraceae bacterium]HPO70680.1 glycoside hydrolase family 97 protein [Anaerohalosphaeraceae bacterium]
MGHLTRLAVGLTLLISAVSVHAGTAEIKSPDGKLKVIFTDSPMLGYSLAYDGTVLMQNCPIGLTIRTADGQLTELGKNVVLPESSQTLVDETITPVVPEKKRIIQDQYTTVTFPVNSSFSLICRVYNDGFAYRIQTKLPGEVEVVAEQIAFAFSEDYPIFFPQEDSFYTHQERSYINKPLSQLTKGAFCSIPAVVDIPGGPKIALTESDVIDYPGCYLQAQGTTTLKAIFPNYPLEERPQGDRDVRVVKRADYLAKTSGTRLYPWRVVIVAPTDADLVLNQTVYKLASDCTLEDTSWIRPGKVAWDWWNANNVYGVDFRAGVNTATYKYFIDFASQYGIEYIILDEGWYPLGNLLKTVPDIDMPELLRYAKQKNVGIILWTTWKTLDEQFEPAMELFSKWQVAGLKVDFMQRDDQKMVQYYEKVAAEAAKRHLLVDFHGAYKPDGLRRRYPNVITREGVQGNEHSKWSKNITPSHTVTLPFIRMVAGPMDFTPGAMRNFQPDQFNPVFNRPGVIGTRCRQLAMYVIYESPLQMLCDSPSNYLREPECMEFLKPVPTVWDDTRVMAAKIAKYLYMARKKGNEWYLGGMTNEDKRTAVFDLSFLDEGTYAMTLFQDGINADRFAEDYRKITKTVTKNDTLTIELASGGGFAARLVKQQ